MINRVDLLTRSENDGGAWEEDLVGTSIQPEKSIESPSDHALDGTGAATVDVGDGTGR